MTKETKRHWKTRIVIPASAVETFDEVFSARECAILMGEIEEGQNIGKWYIEAITPEKPDLAQLGIALALAATAAGIDEPEVDVSSFADVDWLRESLVSFAPVEADRFYIYGSHIKEPPPLGTIPVLIDAATAFGSGEHQTTKSCLLAFADYSKKHKPKNILDMGCGSGILGFAAAKKLKCKVLAVDNDPEAVRVTNQSAKNNALSTYVKTIVGDGYRKRPLTSNEQYDLIFANILAKPLVMMAKDLNKHLKPNGYAILSGLLNRQENWVLGAHLMQGMRLVARYRIDGWSALLVKKGK